MKKVFSSLGIGLASVLMASSVMAQTATQSKDCEAIRARGAGDASLLLFPAIVVEGIHYPSSSGIASIGGSISKNGYQARASLSWSPLDAFRSTLVRKLADANCNQQVAMVQAQQALEYLNDVGKETAYNNTLTYLNEHKDHANDLLSQANKRLTAGVATITDITMLQQLATSLELKRLQAQGQLDVLHAKQYVAKQNSFEELMSHVQNSSMEFERRASNLHRFDAWKTNIEIGGIPPMAGTSDTWTWAGYVSVSYNFGGIPLIHNENQYLDVRSRELRNARYELTGQLTRFRDSIVANMNDLKRQLTLTETQIAQLTTTHNSLQAHLDAPTALNSDALIQLQIMDAESNKELIVGMLTELNKFYGEGK